MARESLSNGERKPEFNGRLTYYHANSRGTGSAIQLELKLSRKRDDKYDCFFMEMAQQKTVSRGKNGRTQATFDWEGKAIVKLDFLDVCEILTVLEGKADHVGGKRNGIYHEVDNMNTIIVFRNDPDRSGCFLGISRKSSTGEQLFKGHITLTEAETTGLRCVLQAGLFHMAFHPNLRTGN